MRALCIPHGPGDTAPLLAALVLQTQLDLFDRILVGHTEDIQDERIWALSKRNLIELHPILGNPHPFYVRKRLAEKLPPECELAFCDDDMVVPESSWLRLFEIIATQDANIAGGVKLELCRNTPWGDTDWNPGQVTGSFRKIVPWVDTSFCVVRSARIWVDASSDDEAIDWTEGKAGEDVYVTAQIADSSRGAMIDHAAVGWHLGVGAPRWNRIQESDAEILEVLDEYLSEPSIEWLKALLR